MCDKMWQHVRTQNIIWQHLGNLWPFCNKRRRQLERFWKHLYLNNMF